jgi:CRP-like cAMP-binding protein
VHSLRAFAFAQVCFLGEEALDARSFWFGAERACDALLGIDVLLTFNTAIYADERTRVTLVTRRAAIAARYVFDGPALLDFVSCIPWDLVAQRAWGAPAGAGAGGGAEHAHRLRAVRLLRAAQLLRLQRVTSAPGRVLARLRDAAGISYSAGTLAALLVACALLSHWLACALHLTTQLQPGDCNWVNAYFSPDGASYDAADAALRPSCLPSPFAPPPSVGARYIAALYWAVMTITTTGYGDVPPQTDAERCVEIAGMLVGAFVYAYVIGAACGLVAQMNERSRALQTALDVATRLGQAQAEHGAEALPGELTDRLRAYLRYVHGRGAAWGEGELAALATRLPPGLRADAHLLRRGGALARCRIFHGAPNEALSDLAAAFAHVTLPPGEALARAGQRCDRLSLLRSGLVLQLQASPPALRSLSRGAGAAAMAASATAAATPQPQAPLFGIEALWRHPVASHAAVTLTYAELSVITRDRLVSLLEKHPALRASCRAYALSRLLFEVMRELGAAHRRVREAAAARRSSGGGAQAVAMRLLPRKIPSLSSLLGGGDDDIGGAAQPQQQPEDDEASRRRAAAGGALAAASACCTHHLSAVLMLDVVRSAAPQLWPQLERSATCVQRAVRRHQLRKRRGIGGGGGGGVGSGASVPPPEAAALSAVAKARAHSPLQPQEGRRLPLQLGSSGVGGADAAALVEAVTAALLPELRRLAGAVDALAADVAALRSERG